MASATTDPYAVLREPVRIGPLTAKNRVEAAPTLTCICNRDQSVTRELVEFYRTQARGGAGIITVHEAAIDADRAVTQPTQLNLGDDFYIPGLASIAEVIKDAGALASIQINHGGRQAVVELNGGRNPIGPSAQVGRFTEDRRRGVQVVEEMTLAMIDEVVDHFAAAACRAQMAGFDMVQIHGGHGWLISQFISPVVNKRTDEYGGSLENRARFALRVVEAVRERCGADFPIEWRLSASDLVPGGLEIDDAVAYARLMQDKVDCFQVSAGMIAEPRTYPYTHPSVYLPHGENVERAAAIKAAVNKPVAAVGSIMDMDEGARWVAEGKTDMVALCRALLADPDLPNKTFKGEAAEIIPCIRCNTCLARGVHLTPVRCTVNPRSVREDYYRCLPLPAVRKKVVVVGGGPAGMTAARTAADRGHQVVLFERSDRLGGNLLVSSGPDFKADYRRFLDYLLGQVHRSSALLRLGTEATPDRVAAEDPDVLILAVGAEPLWPEIPGLTVDGRPAGDVFWAGDVLRGDNVLWHGDVLPAGGVLKGADVLLANDVAQGVQIPGDVVVVAGSGGMGQEAALALAGEGKRVTVVDIPGGSAHDQTVNFLDASLLEELLAERGVVLRRDLVLTEMRPGRVLVAREASVSADGAADAEASSALDNVGEKLELRADALVVATALRPRNDVMERLCDLAEDVRAVGDCRRPRILYNAIHDAFEEAVDI